MISGGEAPHYLVSALCLRKVSRFPIQPHTKIALSGNDKNAYFLRLLVN